MRQHEIHECHRHDAEVHGHPRQQALRDLFAAPPPARGSGTPVRAPCPNTGGHEHAQQDDPDFHALIVAGGVGTGLRTRFACLQPGATRVPPTTTSLRFSIDLSQADQTPRARGRPPQARLAHFSSRTAASSSATAGPSSSRRINITGNSTSVHPTSWATGTGIS